MGGGGGCDNFLDKEKRPLIGPETEVRLVRMHGQRLIFNKILFQKFIFKIDL